MTAIVATEAAARASTLKLGCNNGGARGTQGCASIPANSIRVAAEFFFMKEGRSTVSIPMAAGGLASDLASLMRWRLFSL
jgi:hypothetical protein